MEKFDIKKILKRSTVNVQDENIINLVKNKIVIVTGGGGSIGSELCRQIIKYNPKKIIIYDIYENNLYDIENELKTKYSNFEIVVGSIRDYDRLDEIFSKNKIDIVFHAAAHKHVPMMEKNSVEALKNNVFGTKNVIDISLKYKINQFVLISTDKAVNPNSIMGYTKKMCEMLIEVANQKSQIKFVAVRFGNVLESNGSVIPLFYKQIESGGPITITDKKATRFFMTPQEAVFLILQAAYNGKGGEIFVLDMGNPINIYELVKSILKNKNLVENEDIEVKEIGLRNGEKLHEELLDNNDKTEVSKNKKIFISKSLNISEEIVDKKLNELKNLIKDKPSDINKRIKEIIDDE